MVDFQTLFQTTANPLGEGFFHGSNLTTDFRLSTKIFKKNLLFVLTFFLKKELILSLS